MPNNVSISANDIQKNAQNVISQLLTNKHKKESKTNDNLNAIYTTQSVSKMATNLFNALNTRQSYVTVSNLSTINNNATFFKDTVAFKSFCIKLFKDDLRRKKNNIYNRLLLSKDICQYCHVKSTNALDHYFDKDHSYELAIFPDNLIPICTNCNSTKNNTLFVYPYFVILQKNNWLKCTINADKTFSFSIVKNIATNNFDHSILNDLEIQFNRLNVFKRYISNGQAMVAENISTMNQLKKSGFTKEAAKKFIKNKNSEPKKILFKRTEFYKVSILEGIINDFDKIWINL